MMSVDSQHHLGFAPEHHPQHCPSDGAVMDLRVMKRSGWTGAGGRKSHVPSEGESETERNVLNEEEEGCRCHLPTEVKRRGGGVVV